MDFGYRYYLSCLSQKRASGLLVLKLDGDLVSFSDDHTCHMEGIYTVHIKSSDEMMTELKDVGYVLQLKKNVILIGALEAHGREKLLEKAFSRYSVALWLF